MKMMRWPAIFLTTMLALSACALLPGNTDSEQASIKLPARFQGKLPCADCTGIRTVLNLYGDHTYLLQRTFLGEPDKYSRSLETGQWNKVGGRKLTLTPFNSDNMAQWYVTDNSTLKALDADGRPIDSGLEYTLHRTGKPVVQPLENTYWKLLRMHNNRIQADTRLNGPYIVLHSDKSRVSGASGCNRIMGSYTHDGNKLRFSSLASTRMACPDPVTRTEQAFGQVLAAVRSYRIMGTYLLVFSAQDEPLATFRATAMQ